MSLNDIRDLLARYDKGETTPAENLRVEEWLAAHHNPDNQWERMDPSGRDAWLANVFSSVESRMTAPVVPIRSYRKLWRFAAVAAILLVGFGLLWQRLAAPRLIALTTSGAEKKLVVLSDGSRVWLNTASELTYPEKFNGKTREVFLSGEAYFDIRHDEHQTFIVRTGKITTTVLGTAFDINARKAGGRITVTVTRGKVSVSAGHQLLSYLTPNQQVSYDLQHQGLVKKTVDASQVVAWQGEDLRFDDITFEDAAKVLTERFRVKITFANEKVKACRFSGAALSGKNIDQVLKVICAFNHATYKHEEDGSISIDGKGCSE